MSVPCGAAYTPRRSCLTAGETRSPGSGRRRGQPRVPLWFADGHLLAMSSTARGARGLSGASHRAIPQGCTLTTQVPSRELLCSHHHIRDLGFLRRSVGGMLSPQHGVCACVYFVARGQQARLGAAWQRRMQEVRASCAAWAAPCGPAAAESLSDASEPCKGSAKPCSTVGSTQRHGLGLLSACGAGAGGGVWVRQEIGLPGKAVSACPTASNSPALKVGAGCWGQRLGCILSLAPHPSHC